MTILTKISRLGPRKTCIAGLHRVIRALERREQVPRNQLESAWSDYLSWLSYAVPGMLLRGNIDAMSYAMRHLPNDAPMLEIGSFCGLSTCVLTYLKEKHAVSNSIFTCDRWEFEHQSLGALLGDSKTVTHCSYKDFVRTSFLRNITAFCGSDLPYTIESDSDTFFAWWSASRKSIDVFQRDAQMGGALSFCYIDGNHSYNFAKRDFENTDHHLSSGGFVLFDDSGDDSGWEVCRVVQEVLASEAYELISKNPNYLLRKI